MKTTKIAEIMKAHHINIVNFRPANGAIYTDNIIDQPCMDCTNAKVLRARKGFCCTPQKVGKCKRVEQENGDQNEEENENENNQNS